MKRRNTVVLLNDNVAQPSNCVTYVTHPLTKEIGVGKEGLWSDGYRLPLFYLPYFAHVNSANHVASINPKQPCHSFHHQ